MNLSALTLLKVNCDNPKQPWWCSIVECRPCTHLEFVAAKPLHQGLLVPVLGCAPAVTQTCDHHRQPRPLKPLHKLLRGQLLIPSPHMRKYIVFADCPSFHLDLGDILSTSHAATFEDHLTGWVLTEQWTLSTLSMMPSVESTSECA